MHSSKTVYIASIVIAVSMAAAGWYFFGVSGSGPTSAAFPALSTTTAAALPPPPLPAGWQVFTSEQYHFFVYYPGNLKVKSYDEGGGAATIAFQDVKSAEGFQIFVVPYTQAQISEERFKQDEPSGVRHNAQAASVGGVPAVSFYSTNLALGETAEVWFIRGGYLYEVTTLKPLGSWLSGIMQTWRFE